MYSYDHRTVTQGLEGGLTATSEGGRKSKMAASVAEAAEEGWAEGLPM